MDGHGGEPAGLPAILDLGFPSHQPTPIGGVGLYLREKQTRRPAARFVVTCRWPLPLHLPLVRELATSAASDKSLA